MGMGSAPGGAPLFGVPEVSDGPTTFAVAGRRG